jgi:signal recognition particle GTPase
MKLKVCNKPNFGKIDFLCDDEIHKKLNEYELTKSFLNKSNTTVFLGKQGSGKTSLMVNFVTKLYKKCFHKIYIFMPSYSRASIKNNLFDKNLDASQIYDELNEESITDVYEKCKYNSENKMRSLIIYDDVQKSLKDPSVLLSLKNMIANQRHLRIVNFFMMQNYFSLDKSLRELINNVILFKLGKTQMEKVYNEVIEGNKDDFNVIRNYVFDKPYRWMFINLATQRQFKEFDEIIINDEDD